MQPTMTPLRLELIALLMPIFLGNHPNSGIVLHYAWHGQVSQIFCLFFIFIFFNIEFIQWTILTFHRN